MACEFNALADLEELQIEKSPDTPNTRLQIASNPEPNTSLAEQSPQNQIGAPDQLRSEALILI